MAEPEAVTAAAFTAYWDSLGKTYCGSSDGEARAFAAGWAAAAPHIRAQVYAEIAQLAIQMDARCSVFDAVNQGAKSRPFADLIGGAQ